MDVCYWEDVAKCSLRCVTPKYMPCVYNFIKNGNMGQSQSGKLAQEYEDGDHSIKTMNRGKDEPVLVLASFSLAWGYKLPPPLSANDQKKMFRE